MVGDHLPSLSFILSFNFFLHHMKSTNKAQKAVTDNTSPTINPVLLLSDGSALLTDGVNSAKHKFEISTTRNLRKKYS